MASSGTYNFNLDIDEIIQLVRTSAVETSEYGFSADGVNAFGYQLMAEVKLTMP